MDATRARYAKKPDRMNPNRLPMLYEMGLSSSPLAAFGRESVSRHMMIGSKDWIGEGKFASSVDTYKRAPEVMSDLMVAVLKYQSEPYDDPALRKGCHFHQHKDGKSCEARKVGKDKEEAEKAS